MSSFLNLVRGCCYCKAPGTDLNIDISMKKVLISGRCLSSFLSVIFKPQWVEYSDSSKKRDFTLEEH